MVAWPRSKLKSGRRSPRSRGSPLPDPHWHPRGLGARRVEVPGEGRGRSVRGCREPGASPARVCLLGGLGPGSCRSVVARRRPDFTTAHNGCCVVIVNRSCAVRTGDWSRSHRRTSQALVPCKPGRGRRPEGLTRPWASSPREIRILLDRRPADADGGSFSSFQGVARGLLLTASPAAEWDVRGTASARGRGSPGWT